MIPQSPLKNGERQWPYVLYPQEIRATKLEECQQSLPEMLRRLGELPTADGTLDQAKGQLSAFYEEWRRFRIKACKADGKDWLAQEVYSTEVWKNYERLKKQSTAYRKWKKSDNAKRWKATDEEIKERRRKKQNALNQGRWWSLSRIRTLAERVLKDDPTAKSLKYAPVLRLIKKHATTVHPERAMIEIITIAMECLRFDPHCEASVGRLAWAIKYACLPESKQKLWRDIAQKTYEDSDKPLRKSSRRSEGCPLGLAYAAVSSARLTS